MKKLKRWLEYNGIRVGSVLLVVGLVVAGAWYGFSLKSAEKANVEPEDFGDATSSETALEISHLSYEEGIKLIEGKNMVKGRAVMRRLAPLHVAEKTPRGNGMAHLWMAHSYLESVDLLSVSDLLVEFPHGRRKEVVTTLQDKQLIKKLDLHLEATVYLLKGSRDASELQAEIWLAQGKRNEAITSLLEALANGGEPVLALSVANLLSYQGDDLALQESVWHQFATLGNEVKEVQRGDQGARVAYLVHAMVLRQHQVVELGLEAFARDFGDVTEGHEALKDLRALVHYFKAEDELREEGTDYVVMVEHLIAAFELRPEWGEVKDAIESLIEIHPALKQRVGERLKVLSVSLKTRFPEEMASVQLMVAGWLGAERATLVEEAYRLDPSSPGVVAAWAALLLKSDQVDLDAVRKMLVPQLSLRALDERVKYDLLLAIGEVELRSGNWVLALKAFERALVLADSEDDIDKPALHGYIARCYQSLEMSMEAEKHLILAAQAQ